jgi:RNA polymerase sigma factor (sigma-70 family)
MTYSEFMQYEQDFANKIDTQNKMKQVYEVMDQLKEEQREIIVMKYLSEFSTKEISNITGKSEPNIRKIISR